MDEEESEFTGSSTLRALEPVNSKDIDKEISNISAEDEEIFFDECALSESEVNSEDLESAPSSEVDSDDSAVPTSKKTYDPHYLALLNNEIDDFMNPGRQYDPYDRTNMVKLNGRTEWTKYEKELFFVYLSRRSRHDVTAISRAIGTKTPIECAELITYLEEELKNLKHKEVRWSSRGIRMRRRRIIKTVPSAREMKKKWIKFEEEQSKMLENYREYVDRNREAKMWLRDYDKKIAAENSETAVKLLKQIRSFHSIVNSDFASLIVKLSGTSGTGDEFENEPKPVGSEFYFINVERLLDLSMRLYFSQECLSVSVVNYLHRHAFQASAVQLLHGIVRQFTRRLTVTAIKFAEIRLRVSSSSVFHRVQEIKRSDVEAACKVLGCELSMDRFWRGLKRRNPDIQVFTPRRQGHEELDADGFEEWLERVNK
ncbi:hypothetical protein V1511DRAFT_490064 [Dipodascopsis uninucleata]